MKSWDPFHDLLTIQDRMNKLFETVLTGPAPLSEGQGVAGWRPDAEVVESDGALHIECELPGLEREEVEILVDESTLVVKGERRRPDQDSEGSWTLLERPFGAFCRRFELPSGLDLDNIGAELADGVLRIHLPKALGEGARRVPLAKEGPSDH